MAEHYKFEHVSNHGHIGMPITTSTGVKSLAVTVSNVINPLSLGSKWFGITSGGGNNLTICKVILESTFDNTGVFDLVKPMFVMEYLDHVLANNCKSWVINVQHDDGRVDTEVTRRNIQLWIIWKSQMGAKVLETAQKHVGLPFKRLITPAKNRFSI